MANRLTDKQKRFVDEYLIDLNATQAAIRAGYSVNRASELGYQLLQKTTVCAEIQKCRQERERRTGITQDMVLKELANIGFAKVTDYAEIDGPLVNIKPTDSLTEQQQAAIASIEQGNFGIKLKLYDKVKALELLGKHLGMFDKPEGRRLDMEEDDNLYQAIAEAVKNEI